MVPADFGQIRVKVNVGAPGHQQSAAAGVADVPADLLARVRGVPDLDAVHLGAGNKGIHGGFAARFQHAAGVGENQHRPEGLELGHDVLGVGQRGPAAADLEGPAEERAVIVVRPYRPVFHQPRTQTAVGQTDLALRGPRRAA